MEKNFDMKKRALNALLGFTLAELLVSTLIISIIMVVLAPVITKRVTSNINVSGGGGSTKKESKLFLYNPTDPNCSAVSGQNALDCTFRTGSGVKSMNVVMVSGGGGGAGATTPNYDYGKKLTVTNATIGSAKTQEFTITKGMKNFTVTYLAGSGGGGGGGAWVETAGKVPTSQADCDKYDAKYLTPAQNGTSTGVCVTKWNIGDIPSATNGGIAASVTTVQTNRTCNANACCWQGNTAGSCDSSGTTYSGCNRTVCTWYAGNASCQALAYNGTKAGDWRLPTKDEMAKWKTNISSINKNKGDNGLRLCDYGTGYGAAHCAIYSVCDGATNGFCYPREVWSSTPNGSNYYYFGLDSGSFSQSSQGPRYADSVRCVLEGGGSTYNSYSGGGGSAGGYFKNYQIPESVISNNIGGRIVLYSAPGAKGGNKASSSGSNASNGNNGSESYIALYDIDGNLKWGLKAGGGNGGKGATGSNYGNGGSSVSTNSCKIFQNGSWTNTSCSGVGGAGNNGNKLQVTDSNTAAGGGVGGGSMYNTTSLSGGGNGGSSSSVNGGNGSLYGSGGGGGTTKVVSDVATAGAGGKGANGVAEITYDIVYDPAAGGGGGGGAMLKVENITVTPSTNYVIRVGGGGNGGAVANNGSNGGESKVTFGSVSYTLSGGKGGTAGTSASSTASVVHGVGGNGASKLSTGTSVAGAKGSDGSAGDIGAIGGNGGKSGVQSEGGCGALFDNGGSCSATGAFGLSPVFVSPSNIFDAADYGKAGAGGGGGGYAYNTTMYPTNNPGYGGNGQNGYVYLYWTEYN